MADRPTREELMAAIDELCVDAILSRVGELGTSHAARKVVGAFADALDTAERDLAEARRLLALAEGVIEVAAHVVADYPHGELPLGGIKRVSAIVSYTALQNILNEWHSRNEEKP